MVYGLTLRHARAEVILACRSYVCSQAKYRPFAVKPSGDRPAFHTIMGYELRNARNIKSMSREKKTNKIGMENVVGVQDLALQQHFSQMSYKFAKN